jgi:dCTP deaminase
MPIVEKKQLIDLLKSDSSDSIFIDPLLDQSQIGCMTIDLRLGYDFNVSVLTRNPFIQIASKDGMKNRGVSSYFKETRREIGDKFILYPQQVVLATSLEYLSLPFNYYADILSRSSYTRLGIHINTMVQPGFKGCVPLELFNHGNNAIELIVGSRICQARFFKVNNQEGYLSQGDIRKYYGNVRPQVSKADKDNEIAVLSKIPSL